MSRDLRKQYGDQRITLRQTLVIAVVLHLMLAGVLQWRPDLLYSEPVVAESESSPLEFRFVDMPETAPPEDPPDTEVLSDIDRVAADESERDDAEDPFAEGNTPQEVFRSDPEPMEPQPQPEPVPPSATAEAVEAAADTEERTEEAADVSPDEALTADAAAAEETTAPPETANSAAPPLATSAPVLPPPTRNTLRNSLARGLQQYVEPELFANADGGVDGSQGMVQFDTKGYDLGAYLAEVLRTIERNWKGNIPPAARWQGQEGAVFVNLSIVRDKSSPAAEMAIILIQETWSSGKPAFDQSALIALEISSPLPPIPSYFPYDNIDGRLGFLYNLDPSDVRFPSR